MTGELLTSIQSLATHKLVTLTLATACVDQRTKEAHRYYYRSPGVRVSIPHSSGNPCSICTYTMVGGNLNSGSDVPPFLSTKRMSCRLSVPGIQSKGVTCSFVSIKGHTILPSPCRPVEKRLILHVSHTCVHSGTVTYEDAKKRESRLPLIEPVVVLENEGKRLPELAHALSCRTSRARVPLTPKNRYRIPRRMALSRHRFRHICSKNSNWNGRTARNLAVIFARADCSVHTHCKTTTPSLPLIYS